MAKLKTVRSKRTTDGKSTARASARAAIPCAFLILMGIGLMGLLFYAMLTAKK